MVQTLPGRLPAQPGEPRGSPRGSRIGTARTTRVRARAPSPHAGRPGPLSVQTAAPADARAPIGAPRPPPAEPEAPGPQLLGRDSPRPCASARSPARPRPRGHGRGGGPQRGASWGCPGPGPAAGGSAILRGPVSSQHRGTMVRRALPVPPLIRPPASAAFRSARSRGTQYGGWNDLTPPPRVLDPVCWVSAGRECGAVARLGGEIPGVGV